MFGPVTTGDLHAARIMTGAAMVLWLSVGYVPGLKRHATRVRGAVLVLYLVGCAAVFARAMLR